jgi:hypothetical protein
MSALASALRAPAVSMGVAAACLLALVACAWQLIAGGGERDLVWAALTVATTVGGCVALGCLRSSRVGLTAPQIMLLLGAAGMVGGLAFDARAGGFDALASVCLTGAGNFTGTLRLHWRELPAMHVGMILCGLATVPLLRIFRAGCRRQFCARLAQNLACSGWMVIGMTAGTLLFLRVAVWAGARSPAAMLGGMFGGMVWGMVASVAAYRLWFLIVDRRSDASRAD